MPGGFSDLKLAGASFGFGVHIYIFHLFIDLNKLIVYAYMQRFLSQTKNRLKPSFLGAGEQASWPAGVQVGRQTVKQADKQKDNQVSDSPSMQYCWRAELNLYT